MIKHISAITLVLSLSACFSSEPWPNQEIDKENVCIGNYVEKSANPRVVASVGRYSDNVHIVFKDNMTVTGEFNKSDKNNIKAKIEDIRYEIDCKDPNNSYIAISDSYNYAYVYEVKQSALSLDALTDDFPKVSKEISCVGNYIEDSNNPSVALSITPEGKFSIIFNDFYEDNGATQEIGSDVTDISIDDSNYKISCDPNNSYLAVSKDNSVTSTYIIKRSMKSFDELKQKSIKYSH